MELKDSSDFSQANSHALQQLSTPSMGLKSEQKASIKSVYKGKRRVHVATHRVWQVSLLWSSIINVWI